MFFMPPLPFWKERLCTSKPGRIPGFAEQSVVRGILEICPLHLWTVLPVPAQMGRNFLCHVEAPVYLVSKGSSRAVSRMMAENEHVQPLLNGGSARMWGNHLISHLRGPTNLSMSFWRSSDAVLGFHWELQGICHSGQGFWSVA